MKIKKSIIPIRLLLPIGLLMATLPNFIKISLNVTFPDFLCGLLVGTGLALEIISIVMMRKSGKSYCKVKRQDVQL